MQNMNAKIQTKSNYKNLNGQWLEVHEIRGTRVSCIVKDDEAKDGQIISDFTLSEIVEMNLETQEERKAFDAAREEYVIVGDHAEYRYEAFEDYLKSKNIPSSLNPIFQDILKPFGIQ